MRNPVRGSTTSPASVEHSVRDAGMEARPAPGPEPADPDQAQQMLAFGIRHDGRRYCFGNYCSVRLQDALAYARLVAMRALYVPDVNTSRRRTRDGDAKPPGDSDRALMATLGVSFDDGRYVFEGGRYNRLADAVAFARLRRVHGH